MSGITINKLSKTYPPPLEKLRGYFGMENKGAVSALSGITFEVERGEVFGLIGRNGAGKTTLTKIIATLVQPTSGTVSVFGHDTVANDVQVRSLIGLATAEERSFYWRLTCLQNLMFFARLYGMSDKAAKQRTGKLLEQFNMSDLAKRRFSDLSTGNKQKLAVARALMSEPKLLLLDEPTRSLDPLAAAGMREAIADLKGITILLTSHNLTEIEQLCGRVAVISKGEIRDIGTPVELRGRHSEEQKVKIKLNGAIEDSLITLNNLKNFRVERDGGEISVSFDREHHDGSLNEAVTELNAKGANILDIETERATLLDVLEKYE